MFDIELYKKKYPKGTRIRLVSMDDSQAPSKGTLGTITGIGRVGSNEGVLYVEWDTGSVLNLLVGIDEFEVV